MDILKQVLDTYKLPDNGKLVDSSGQLPHHVAVADNTEHSKNILELLSGYPFDVEAKDRNAKTALDCCGKADIVCGLPLKRQLSSGRNTVLQQRDLKQGKSRRNHRQYRLTVQIQKVKRTMLSLPT